MQKKTDEEERDQIRRDVEAQLIRQEEVSAAEKARIEQDLEAQKQKDKESKQ